MSMSKSLDQDQDRHFVSSDLGPSCLQMLSVYDTSMQRGLCSWRLLEKSFLSPDICRCRLLKWVSLSVFLAICRFIDIRVLRIQGICHLSSWDVGYTIRYAKIGYCVQYSCYCQGYWIFRKNMGIFASS